MKKWILSAAFICCISGFAAAQKTPSKAVTKTEQKTPQKGKEAKAGNSKQLANNKSQDKAFTLAIPKPNSDTLLVPKVKNEEE